MADGYGSHRDYMERVKQDAEARHKLVDAALRDAFAPFIEKREVEVVVFSSMSAVDLAGAITKFPSILKVLLATCNIAARAIERDLGINNLDTYRPRLNDSQANVVAGYIKPYLPPYLELPALCHIDRIWFVDKEIRKGKGRWEREVLLALNQIGQFYKRKFRCEGEEFELDAASPKSGNIEIGIDIKRIEARRDIHKRCDEIVNKADKLKKASPNSRFGAVIYYPFIDEQINVQSRLKSTAIDEVVFASESKEAILNAVKMLMASLKSK